MPKKKPSSLANASAARVLRSVARSPVKKTGGLVYLLRVSVDEIRPEIWRTVLVPEDYTLAYLHVILQTLMDWLDYHLHQFKIDGAAYGRPDYDVDAQGLLDERRVKLSDVVPFKKKFKYEYDFGDGWELTIVAHEIWKRDPKASYPECVDGRRSAPPEDVGGPGGYEDLLEAISNPTTERHQELLEWIGGEFDPKEFDLKRVNWELRKIFRLLD